ncbi:MAG: histidine kinase [Planctomycetota bacterium]
MSGGPIERARRPAVVVAVGLALTVVFAIADPMILGASTDFGLLLVFGQGVAWLWWALAPLIVRAVGAMPLDGGVRIRTAWGRATAHFALSLVLALVAAVGYVPLNWWFTLQRLGEDVGDWAFEWSTRNATHYFFLPTVLFYWLVVAATHVGRRAEEVRRREADLARAQLDVLSMQMSPHFLFNALHAVSALASSDDPKRASDLVARIGSALRESMTLRERPTGTLAEELEVLDDYLEIERIRLGDRVRIEVDVDESALGCTVPRWLLQPLVENALAHGVGELVEGGRVDVRAHVDGRELVLEVLDDGAGLSVPVVEGVGLRNVRERLRALHGDAASLELAPAAPSGARAVIRLPVARSDPR